MKKVIAFFIENPIWANAILIVTFLFGMVALMNLDNSFFPEQDPNRINISVAYPGASPVEMEEGVTIKVEQAIKGINGIEDVSSSSSENRTSVNVVLYKDGVDIDEVMDQIESAVNGISNFPAGAEKPMVVKQRSYMNSRASKISLTGKVGLNKLKEVSDQVVDDLLNTDAISQVLTSGLPSQEFAIKVKEDQLLRYGLTFDQIANAIRMGNRDVTGGTIKTNEEEFIIRSRSKKTYEEGVRSIVVKSTPEGEIIRIGDVATVDFDFSDSPSKTYVNAERSVNITVMKLETEDLRKITKEVNKYVNDFNEKNKELKLQIEFQFFDMLRERIDMLVSNGLMGLLLVLIVLGLFLNVRLASWVALGIPISFLGMFAIGFMYGMTINMVSLFGMILVVGILVDDGIVIAENIYAHYEKGKSPYRSALDGSMEVLPSVVTSVLTTVVAFGVLFFVEDMERMYEMAFVVIACLLFSLIEAFLVLPSHLNNKSLQKKPGNGFFGKIKQGVTKGIAYLRDKVYREALELLLMNKWGRRLSVIVPLLFIFTIVTLMNKGVIKSTFFPAIPFDEINVEVAFQPGETVEQTEKFLWECYDAVDEVRKELEIEFQDTLITFVSLETGSTRNLGESGSHTGNIEVSLDVENKPISSFQIADRIRAKITPPDNVQKYMVGGMNRWGSPVAVSLKNKDYKTLNKARKYFKEQLADFGTLKDITDNSGKGNREVIIKLTDQAKSMGLTEQDIAKQIRQGFYGEEAQRFIIGDDEIKVWVRYSDEDRKSLSNLDRMRIKTPAGNFPLTALVAYTIERGIVSVKHLNGEREIQVTADMIDPYGSVMDVNTKIEKEIIPKIKAQFPGVNVELRGQAKSGKKSQDSMAVILVILVILLILILSLSFNSLWQGLLFIPVILVGPFCAILGHGIEGYPVSIFSAWGIIALLGILINDAVVYLDVYNRSLRQGMSPVEAVVEAGTKRFRAILLTSLTTIAGLYPLILETSFQAKFLIPMAISVAYGVLFGTVFILLFFPVLILFFHDIRKTAYWVWEGEWPVIDQVEPALIDERKRKELGIDIAVDSQKLINE